MELDDTEMRILNDSLRWRIVVCGSRSWGSWTKTRDGAHRLWKPTADERIQTLSLMALLDGFLIDAETSMAELTVIHGACPSGADAIAEQWATSRLAAGRPLKVERHPADWDTHGRRAGVMRSHAMVDSLDPSNPHHFVIAAWDGESRGTAHTVRYAERSGLVVATLGSQWKPAKVEAQP